MHAHATGHKMETCLQDFAFASIDFIYRAPVIAYYDSQHLPATTAATSAASTATTEAATTSEASTTTAEAATTTSEASTATTEVATARSHAGEATITVAACVGSIESPGATSESIPVTCTTARKITTAYAIGSARTKTGATGAIRATNASCAVAEACIPSDVA
jgi:hypothetical protein